MNRRKRLNEMNGIRWPNWIYSCLDSLKKLMKEHPARVSVGLLLVFYVPNLLLFYPGIPNGDNIGQLAQGFGIEVYNNHHPVLHTLLLSLCMRLGQVTLGDNAGLFYYVLLQNVFLVAVVSYAVWYLIRHGVRMRYAWLLLLYYCIHPILQNYALCIVKDTWYAGMTALLLIRLHCWLEKTSGRRNVRCGIGCLVCLLIMTLLRNDGIYMAVLLCAGGAVLAGREYRKDLLKILVVLIVFSLAWNKMVLPLADVEKGSSREMLSMPFQQTARYVRDYSSEVTEEERESIDAVLVYEELAARYEPTNADPVKITYREEATTEEVLSYLYTWLQMLRKHPMVYLEATWENKCEYFVPIGIMHYADADDAEQIMTRIKDEVTGAGIVLSYPDRFAGWRERAERYRELLSRYTPLLVLRIPCVYIWFSLGIGIYWLIRRNCRAFLFCLPFWINLLVNIAGPMNGSYTRYMYLYLFALPITVVLGSISEEGDVEQRTQ